MSYGSLPDRNQGVAVQFTGGLFQGSARSLPLNALLQRVAAFALCKGIPAPLVTGLLELATKPV